MRLYGLIGYPLTHSFSKDISLKNFSGKQLKIAGTRIFNWQISRSCQRSLKIMLNWKG